MEARRNDTLGKRVGLAAREDLHDLLDVEQHIVGIRQRFAGVQSKAVRPIAANESWQTRRTIFELVHGLVGLSERAQLLSRVFLSRPSLSVSLFLSPTVTYNFHRSSANPFGYPEDDDDDGSSSSSEKNIARTAQHVFSITSVNDAAFFSAVPPI